MRYLVKMEALIEAESQVAADLAAERISKLLGQPLVKITLQGSGVKLLSAQILGKPTAAPK
jgi:hypothetical protein